VRAQAGGPASAREEKGRLHSPRGESQNSNDPKGFRGFQQTSGNGDAGRFARLPAECNARLKYFRDNDFARLSTESAWMAAGITT
jgi:hypothetical protein